MQIFIKTPTNQIIPINVQSSDTIHELKDKMMAAIRHREQETKDDKMTISLESTHLVMFKGKELEDDRTLHDYSICEASTLDITTPLSSPPTNPPTKSSSKCPYKACTKRAAKIVGVCRYCSHVFCGVHRLPESHACQQMSTCKQQSRERNSNRLLEEKCVGERV